jgi:hypothetical protein
MRNVLAGLLMLCVMAGSFEAGAHEGKTKKRKPLIQIALLLDTSNSMDGLINQAKSQLWKIVNEFVTARQHGVRPKIEVALYEYGNDRLSAKDGYIRKVLGMTSDLDRVSESLFALTTNGGSEYCGQVIKVAGRQLDWSSNRNDLKVIIIAGNEPFTQGPVKYRKAVKGVIKKGVVVNTIHCGPYDVGVKTGWKDGAVLADGQYMNIDQDKAVAHIDAPQDDEIAKLGNELNDTYIPYGDSGGVAYARQATEDGNAEAVAAGSMVNRAVFKSSHSYSNESWDLVDAVNTKSVDLDEVDEKKLPAKMRKMDTKERKKFVEKQVSKRKKIQSKIRKLNKDRETFVAKKQEEMEEETGEASLDAVMIKSLRTQAVEADFEFE